MLCNLVTSARLPASNSSHWPPTSKLRPGFRHSPHTTDPAAPFPPVFGSLPPPHTAFQSPASLPPPHTAFQSPAPLSSPHTASQPPAPLPPYHTASQPSTPFPPPHIASQPSALICTKLPPYPLSSLHGSNNGWSSGTGINLFACWPCTGHMLNKCGNLYGHS